MKTPLEFSEAGSSIRAFTPLGNVSDSLKLVSLVQLTSSGPRGVGIFPFGQFQIAWVCPDHRAFPAGRERLRAENETWQQVRGRGTPRVIPILVRLVFLIPRFPSDCCTALDHVFPTAIIVRHDEPEGVCARVVRKECFEQVLR